MMGLQWLKNTLLQIEEFGDAFTRGGGDLLKLTTDRFVWEKGFRKWHSVLQNTSQKFNFSNVGNLMKSFNFYIHLLQFHQIFVKLCKYHILIPWPELMVFCFPWIPIGLPPHRPEWSSQLSRSHGELHGVSLLQNSNFHKGKNIEKPQQLEPTCHDKRAESIFDSLT